MNNLVVFDLDGVLVDSKDWHYEALNNALSLVDEKYTISYSEHLSTYDGLNTTKKLKLLTERKGLDPKYYDQIWENKQKFTVEMMQKECKLNKDLIFVFSRLKEEGFNIAVASNSIRETVEFLLKRLGVISFVDIYLSNEDVDNPKPSPEIYNKIIDHFGIDKENILIVEDSEIGIASAIQTGVEVFVVQSPKDITIENLYRYFK